MAQHAPNTVSACPDMRSAMLRTVVMLPALGCVLGSFRHSRASPESAQDCLTVHTVGQQRAKRPKSA
eukprot:11785728-Alexandrium_andersonii.AAC.1